METLGTIGFYLLSVVTVFFSIIFLRFLGKDEVAISWKTLALLIWVIGCFFYFAQQNFAALSGIEVVLGIIAVIISFIPFFMCILALVGGIFFILRELLKKVKSVKIAINWLLN